MMEFATEDKVELEAVQDHWRSTAHFDQLSIFEVREAATRIAQVRTGEVDITEVPLASLEKSDLAFRAQRTRHGVRRSVLRNVSQRVSTMSPLTATETMTSR